MMGKSLVVRICLGGISAVSAFCPSLNQPTIRPFDGASINVIREFGTQSRLSGLRGKTTTEISLVLKPIFLTRSKTPPLRYQIKGKFAQINQWRAKSWSKMRRAAILAFAIAIFWGGSVGLRALPAHASSTVAPAPTLQERIVKALPKSMPQGPSLDTIVNRYVQKHMFDDDVYDKVSSTYREVYHDAEDGAYPNALREVTSSVLGAKPSTVKGTFGSPASRGVGLAMFDPFLKAIQKMFGIDEMMAVLLLSAVVLTATPLVFLSGSMTIGLFMKRKIGREMKKRYGKGYTLDATIKVDEDVDAPDGDDDVSDDDDDNTKK